MQPLTIEIATTSTHKLPYFQYDQLWQAQSLHHQDHLLQDVNNKEYH